MKSQAIELREVKRKINTPNNKPKNGYKIGDVIFKKKRKGNFSHFSVEEFQGKWAQEIDHFPIYLPLFCKLVRKIGKYFDKDPFIKYQEYAFSRLISEDTVKKFGLIESWPYYLFEVRPFLKRKNFETITDRKKIFLDPVQCALIYEYFSKYPLKINDLPIHVKEIMGGWSYRNESCQELVNIVKSVEFLRYEYICIGAKDQAIKERELLLDGLIILFLNMNLEFRLTVGKGCYDQKDIVVERKCKKAQNYNDIPILDLEVYLPHISRWVEIAGCSNLGDAKTKEFGVECGSLILESSCVGIGISRLALAFLSQNGLNEDNWPKFLDTYQ